MNSLKNNEEVRNLLGQMSKESGDRLE